MLGALPLRLGPSICTTAVATIAITVNQPSKDSALSSQPNRALTGTVNVFASFLTVSPSIAVRTALLMPTAVKRNSENEYSGKEVRNDFGIAQ